MACCHAQLLAALAWLLLEYPAGIKVALPSESASGRCFLQLYCETILALQEASGAAAEGRQLPLAIMTSDDTHARTQALLEQHSYFGMQAGQVPLRCPLSSAMCCAVLCCWHWVFRGGGC